MRTFLPLILMGATGFGCGRDQDRPRSLPPQSPAGSIYQIGDAFSRPSLKVLIQDESLDAEWRERVRTVASGLGFRGGSWIYLGSWEGIHLVATNSHVMDFVSGQAQTSRVIRFEGLSGQGIAAELRENLGQWPEIDFALGSLQLSEDEANDLYAVPFVPHRNLNARDAFVTMGYGIQGHPTSTLSVNADSDCRLFSDPGGERRIADPDVLNTGPYQVWSFAHGCDISHGDSGSPILLRNSLELVGLNWTASTAQKPRKRDPAWLQTLDASKEDIWTDLAYAVPFTKILELICSNPTQADTKRSAPILSLCRHALATQDGL